MDNIKQICARIKDLREFSDYTLEDFAAKLELDPQVYAEYESGENDLPIGLLYNIAAALLIDPTVLLFGRESTATDVDVCYQGKGVKIERYTGYAFTSLAENFVDRELEPMIVVVKEGIKPELVYHKGQEFNYVLQGELRVIHGSKEYFLRKGDSIYFDASIPHAEVPMGKQAKFLCVIQK